MDSSLFLIWSSLGAKEDVEEILECGVLYSLLAYSDRGWDMRSGYYEVFIFIMTGKHCHCKNQTKQGT